MEADNKGPMPPPEEGKPGTDELLGGQGGGKPGPGLWRTLLVFLALFLAGVGGGYYFLSERLTPEPEQAQKAGPTQAEEITLRVYYPYKGRLNMEERKIAKTTSKASLAEAIVAEFLKGPAQSIEFLVPPGTKVLGVYLGDDGILYVDLSDEFRRNFQGDTLSEHLLLRGLYESVVWNVYGVEGVKALIEGAEIETVGGHISAERPLTVRTFHAEKEADGAE